MSRQGGMGGTSSADRGRLSRLGRALLPWLAPLGPVACASAPGEEHAPAADTSQASLYADHVSGEGRFFNPWERSTRGRWDFLKWMLSPNPYDKGGEPDIPFVVNDGAELATVQHSAKITWVGHATAILHDGADVVLTDPHFGERALLPKRKFPPGVPLSAIPKHAFSVLSHNHYDHLDADTVESLPATMKWFVPRGLAAWFRERGRQNVVELDWWQSARHGRWTVTCVPAQHWSRRIGQATNSTLWCGWVLDSGEYRYFFPGDTGYFHGFAEIGRRYGPIDVALLPIGAYEPRWFMRYAHMNPAEAWQAFGDLGARYLVPVHWGTFDLTDEPLDRPLEDLRAAVQESGGDFSRVKPLAIGGSWHVPREAPRPAAAADG